MILQIKRLVSILLPTLLCACAATYYQSAPGPQSSRLRVATDLDGNTGFEAARTFTCGGSSLGNLGFFHPGSADWQAYRRGFDRKLGMPLSAGLQANMFAEYVIDGTRPFFVRASNVAGTGGVILTGGSAYVPVTTGYLVVGFTPTPGHDYELDFTGDADVRNLRLFELENGARRPMTFDAGMKPCTLADQVQGR